MWVSGEDDRDRPLLSDDNKPAEDDGDERFGAHKPLRTVLKLMLGPIMFNLTGSFQDAIDFWLISLTYGETGLSIIGFATTFRYLLNGMASFPGQACTIKVSSLLGERDRDTAAQVVVDLFRFGVILSIAVPVVVWFTARDMMAFMDCPGKWVDATVQYALPVCAMMFMTCAFRISCGLVLGEGRWLLHAIMHLLILVLNCGVFDPVFLLGLRLPVWSVALSYCLSLGVPGLTLMVLIFAGRFTVQPKWSMWLRRPSKATWAAIQLSFSNLLTFLTGAFPSMVFYHFLYRSCDNSGYAEMSAVMPVTLKVYNLIGEVTIGIASGCLAAGSWAFSRRRYRRLLWLCAWAAVIAVAQQVVMTPVMIVKPSLIMRIWLKTDHLLKVCDKFMPVIFYANMLLAIHETGTDLLLATGHPYLAVVPMATRGVLFGLGSYIYFLADPNEPANVLFVFPSIDIAMFLSIGVLLPRLLKQLWVSDGREE